MTCDAPYNDLGLLQQLEVFNDVDSHIALAALRKLKGHLWYISEDLAEDMHPVLQYSIRKCVLFHINKLLR